MSRSALPLPSPIGRRRALRKLAGCTALVALPGLLAACQRGRSEAGPADAASAADAPPPSGGKVWSVGTDASYAPFESQDDKGEFIGFDIELVQAAASGLFELEFINTPWEGLITGLERGDLDAAVSAIAITDERRKTLDFTAPYFIAQQLVLVPTSSKAARLGDLRGLRVGVQSGAAGDDIVSTLFEGKQAALIQRMENLPLALAELEAGQLDAVVGDNGVLAHHVAQSAAGKYRLIDDPGFDREPYAIAVRKGQRELLDLFEQGLKAMQADGRYAALHKRWFGDLPLPAATAASR